MIIFSVWEKGKYQWIYRWDCW